MSRPFVQTLSITTCAVSLITITLGMVMTVSAARPEVSRQMIVQNEALLPPKPITKLHQPATEQAVPHLTMTESMAATNTSTVDTVKPKVTNNVVNAKKNIVREKVTLAETTVPPQKLTKPSTATTTVTQTTLSFSDALSKRIFELTNEFRQREGLVTLTQNNALTLNATSYSGYMLQHKRLSHTDAKGCDSTCRFKRDGYTAESWGENLALYSFTAESSVEEVAQFFMLEWEKSAGHRANLVSSVFTTTGIGVTRNKNLIYVAVHFTLPYYTATDTFKY